MNLDCLTDCFSYYFESCLSTEQLANPLRPAGPDADGTADSRTAGREGRKVFIALHDLGKFVKHLVWRNLPGVDGFKFSRTEKITPRAEKALQTYAKK